MSIQRPILLTTLSSLFLLEFIVLAINPHNRADWLLENVLVVIAVFVLVLSDKKLPLSKISYLCIFIFLSLHEIGSHYTYSLVPYNQWSDRLLGISINEYFGWQRNHFDRMIHLAYGMLLAYPIRELYIRLVKVKGFWGYFLPLNLTMSSSLVYELIEWAAATIFGAELGAAYLGTQGDNWDAHKDMLLASIGAAITMTITALIHMQTKRDFAREWIESITPLKDRQG